MTKKDKQLLLRDLCARLPYGVKCQFEDTIRIIGGECDPYYDYELGARHLDLFINHKNFYIKPYLRPISSMTEDEKVKYLDLLTKYRFSDSYEDYVIYDWLNKNMFDYRGLISKGLAIEVTKEKPL